MPLGRSVSLNTLPTGDGSRVRLRIFSNAVDTFRRQLQPVILRVRLIHPCQVLGILRQYLSGLRFRGIRHGTQYFIYLFLPTKSQTLAGFPHLLKSICQFSHCSQID